MVQYVDWIGVMTYDYHNALERETGHVAPLYHQPGDHTVFLNANFSVRYWLDKGVPADKIVMGIPAYGSSFTLSGISRDYTAVPSPGFHEEVSGPGEPGKFTKSAGFLAYYEVREYLSAGIKYLASSDGIKCLTSRFEFVYDGFEFSM